MVSSVIDIAKLLQNLKRKRNKKRQEKKGGKKIKDRERVVTTVEYGSNVMIN